MLLNVLQIYAILLFMTIECSQSVHSIVANRVDLYFRI